MPYLFVSSWRRYAFFCTDSNLVYTYRHLDPPVSFSVPTPVIKIRVLQNCSGRARSVLWSPALEGFGFCRVHLDLLTVSWSCQLLANKYHRLGPVADLGFGLVSGTFCVLLLSFLQTNTRGYRQVSHWGASSIVVWQADKPWSGLLSTTLSYKRRHS